MMLLSPINLLTLKSKVVMLPPGDFTAPDIYYRKYWRRVQHISNEFWSRWRKEALEHQALQCWQRWNTIRRDSKVGDDMVLRCLERPVNKLVMLVENEWLRWYAWVRFYDREPFMNDWEVSICFNIPRGAICRKDIVIQTFTIVNSWLLPYENFTCVNLRTTHIFCTLYSLIFFIVTDTCFELGIVFSLIDLYFFWL